ncbi:Glutaredoxin [Cyphellophora attinorum]|uniref:Glutaredoxin n=1 Tax=Cyphellophora attinorum TaxID=1664694 RepID=A0A0N1HR04_9EURO|nr:Glutaredoxin [Phialophora attinorum]KPI38074.1 Glutaredoxin [Phialophora attinorum]
MGSSLSTSSSMPTAESRAKVQHLIQDNKVVVFAKVSCPYCVATKALLKRKGIDYTSINVDTTSGGTTIFNTVKEMTGQRTVPNIFIAQQQIGGNSELQALNRTGDLDEMLRKAGALA